MKKTYDVVKLDNQPLRSPYITFPDCGWGYGGTVLFSGTWEQCEAYCASIGCPY